MRAAKIAKPRAKVKCDGGTSAIPDASCPLRSAIPARQPLVRGELLTENTAWQQLAPHSIAMSRHFETSEPRPEEMMMQPRILRALLSLAHTA